MSDIAERSEAAAKKYPTKPQRHSCKSALRLRREAEKLLRVIGGWDDHVEIIVTGLWGIGQQLPLNRWKQAGSAVRVRIACPRRPGDHQLTGVGHCAHGQRRNRVQVNILDFEGLDCVRGEPGGKSFVGNKRVAVRRVSDSLTAHPTANRT